MSAAYCTRAEIGTLGIASSVIADIPVGKRDAAIASASDTIDGYLARFTLPLIAWNADIRTACAVIAAYTLLAVRGFSPEGDEAFLDRYKSIIRWLENVAKGTVVPTVTDSSPGAEPGVTLSGARVISGSSRGYSTRGTGQSRGRFQGD